MLVQGCWIRLVQEERVEGDNGGEYGSQAKSQQLRRHTRNVYVFRSVIVIETETMYYKPQGASSSTSR